LSGSPGAPFDGLSENSVRHRPTQQLPLLSPDDESPANGGDAGQRMMASHLPGTGCRMELEPTG